MRFSARVMDPLTCVSLAGTVIQFVDFSCKLISASGELYQDSELGTTKADAAVAKAVKDHVASIIKDIKDYRFKLQLEFRSEAISAGLTNEEAALEILCHDCNKEADNPIKYLDKLKIPENSKIRAWKSMEQALLSVWSRKELDAMMKRLLEYRKAIDSRVLLFLGYVCRLPVTEFILSFKLIDIAPYGQQAYRPHSVAAVKTI